LGNASSTGLPVERAGQQHDEYRTKWVILEMYGAPATPIDTGQPYQPLLDPSPGPPHLFRSSEKFVRKLEKTLARVLRPQKGGRPRKSREN